MTRRFRFSHSPLTAAAFAWGVSQAEYAVLVWASYRTALEYRLLLWVSAVFGPSPYSMRDALLPHLLAQSLLSVPVLLTALRVYEWFRAGGRRFSLRQTLVVTAVVAILLAIGANEPLTLSAIRPTLLVAFVVVLSGVLGFALSRTGACKAESR